MSITEEIYRQVQQLPEGMAEEVLEFINYLKKRRGLPHEPIPPYKRSHHACLHTIRENPDDEVWNDLLFGQSRFDAATVNKAGRAQELEAEQCDTPMGR